jgi:type VI secretion system secreted protein Hcp
MASSQIFLDIEFENAGAVRGDATLHDYAGLIEIESFEWGMEAAGDVDSSNPKGPKGRIAYQALTLKKGFDGSTTALLACLKARDPVVKAKLTLVHGHGDSAGRARDVLTVLIKDGFLEELNVNMSEGDKSISVREDLTFSYRHIEFSYRAEKSGDSVRRQQPVAFQAHLDTEDALGPGSLFG